MKFPPKSLSAYILDTPQDKRIFKKLAKLSKKSGFKDEKLIKFLHSQLEDDWRTPLERFINKLLK